MCSTTRTINIVLKCFFVRLYDILYFFLNSKITNVQHRVYGIQTIVKHIRHMNLEKQTTYYRSKMQF